MTSSDCSNSSLCPQFLFVVLWYGGQTLHCTVSSLELTSKCLLPGMAIHRPGKSRARKELSIVELARESAEKTYMV